MGKPSKLQDLSLFPGVNDGLKHLQAGAKFYLHGYDKSRGFDKGLVRTEPPADPARLSFIATFYNEGRKLMLRTENARDPADKQRYLLRVGDPTYPFRQFNPEGKDDHADPTRKPWRDQHGDWLFSEATGKLIDPPKTKSFEIQCASCHHTGHSLTPTVSGGFNRRLRERPPWRGRHRGRRRRQRAEPGLRNPRRRRLGAIEDQEQGQAVAHRQPRPPGGRARHGDLHAVPQPAAGHDGQRHADQQDDRMRTSGISRNEYLVNHTSREDAAQKDFRADGVHSRSHHPQGTDLIRSKHYANEFQTLSCSSCHKAEKIATQ